MDRVLLTFLALIMGGVALSLLLSRFIKRKWLWYVPSIIGVLIIASLSLKIHFEDMEGFEELGYHVINLMIMAFMVGNLISNVFITLKRNTKRGKKGSV